MDIGQLPWKVLMQSKTQSELSQDPQTALRGMKVFHDDMYSDQDIKSLKLNAKQNHQAKVWSLTSGEEKRYVLLMQNRSGLYWQDAHMSPVEILGINARSGQEREHFAMLYAKQLQERLAKELAWQTAASRAKAKVNQGLPIIRPFDVSPVIGGGCGDFIAAPMHEDIQEKEEVAVVNPCDFHIVHDDTSSPCIRLLPITR